MGRRHIEMVDGDRDAFTLERDGDRPLRFTGTLLGSASSRTNSGPGQNRWWEVGLYATEGGAYVVQVVGVTCWQGEVDHHTVKTAAAPEEVLVALRECWGGQLPPVAVAALDAAGRRDAGLGTVAVEVLA